MGQRAKWLQDERYIRIAGALLMVSPFLNYLASVAFSFNNPDKWAFKQLVAGFMLASGFSWLGRVSNFVVGFLMFRGKSSAWVPVLAILGFTIAKNIITFKTDFQTNRLQTVGGLVINILLFLLVFESEYRINKEINRRIKEAQQQRAKNTTAPAQTLWQQSIATQNASENPLPTEIQTETQTPRTNKILPKPKVQLKPQPKKIPVTSQSLVRPQVQEKVQTPISPVKIKPQTKSFVVRKGAPIDFDGHGKFAEVFHCTENELWLKVTDHLPSDIHKKIVTLQVPGKKGLVRLKFSRLRDDSTLIFRVIA